MPESKKPLPEIAGARFITRSIPSGGYDVALEYTVPNGSGVALESTVLARCRNSRVAAILLEALETDATVLEEDREGTPEEDARDRDLLEKGLGYEGPSTRTQEEISSPASRPFVDVVFDGPPGPESGRFVEVEDSEGRSIDYGEWLERDGYHVLRLPRPSGLEAGQALEERFRRGEG